MSTSHVEDCLAGGGEMGALMRDFDWRMTPVGAVDSWPQSLRTAVSILLESKFAMLIAWGPEFTQFYNDAYRPILGSTKHPAIGKSTPDVFPELWPTIGPLFEGVMRGEGVGFDDLMLALDRNGYLEECFFTFSYSPIRDETGRVGGVHVTVTETTARVLAERRLRILRDLATSASQIKSESSAFTSCADILAASSADLAFAALYKVESDGRSAKRVDSDLVPFEIAPSVIDLGATDGAWPPVDLIAAGKPQLVSDLRDRFGDYCGRSWPEPVEQALILPITRPGLVRPYGVLVAGVSPRRALDDSYRDFFLFAADQIAMAIANARTYEEEKRRADALAELDRQKTAFFSNVSHEFRTPLTLMLGPAEDLLRGEHGDVPARQRGQLEVLHRNALRLQKLVNALLDFSRIQAGRLQASYEPIDLAALTRDIASTFRTTMERGGLSFEIDCPPLDEPVCVDRDMWEKMILNLLSNAFKFTFEGSVAVSLIAAGGSVVLVVKDTGVGIAPEHLPRLFERFHRIEGIEAHTHEGSGIGLALVSELAKLHGGSVQCESRVGTGTTLTVTIPKGSAHLPNEHVRSAGTPRGAASGSAAFVEEALRWLPAAEGDGPLAASARVGDGEALSSQPGEQPVVAGRILLADDNADLREYVQHLLEPTWLVDTAEDGVTALAMAQQKVPDLIITDVMMPRLDGFGLLRELRGDPRTRHIPLLMLSARAGEEAKLEGLAAGAEDYLIKPFSARELLAKVNSHWAQSRLRRDTRTEYERLYSLFMQAPEPICVFRGEDLVYEMANDLYFKMCGRSDIVGKPLLQALPEFTGQGFDDLLLGVMRTGRAFVGNEMLLRLDRRGTGELEDTYWTFTYAPLRGMDGTVDRVMCFCHEVTDQVVARGRIHESEARFRRVVTQVQAGIAQTDLTGRFTLTNNRYCEIVGRSHEQLLQLCMQDITHPDDLPRNLEQFRTMLEDGAPFIIEKRYVRPDGSMVWVQNSVSRIDDAEGQPLGAAAVTIDITQRKSAESAVQENEARIRELLGKERAARKEADSVFRVANSLVEAKLDLESLVQRLTDQATELVGAKFGAFFYNVVSESGEAYLLYTLSGAPKEAFERFGLPRNTPLFADTFSGKGVVRLDDVKADSRYGKMSPHHGMPAGHLPVTSYLAVPVVGRSGQVFGGLFFGHPDRRRFTEAHERMVVAIAAQASIAMENASLYKAARSSETRFRAIFETAEVSIWEEDFSAVKQLVETLKAEHGAGLRAFLQQNPSVVDEAIGLVRVRDVNPATLRMFGATSKAEILGSLSAIFVPETRSVFVEELLALAEGKRLLSTEAPVRTLSGERIDALVTLSFPPADQNPERVLVTLVDISARKIAEREREARYEQMERAVKFSETFMGIVGHDLRNPLGAIVMSTDALLRMKTPERIARPILRIRNSADRMTRMIEQLLDFTRARIGGGIAVECVACDLREVTAHLVAELEGAAPREIVLQSKGDTKGVWDRDRLAQVLSNLLGNALEHGAPDESIRVTLDGSRGASVQVTVWNAGGISQQHLGELFDPFRRAGDKHRAAKSTGLGLGLYIVQQIVQAHGGSIDVQSAEETGTAFIVVLPRTTAR